MWGWGCGFKWTWSCWLQPMLPHGCDCWPFELQITHLQVVISWGNDKSNRVIGVSPRNRNISWQPQKLILIRVRVMGWVLIGTFLWHLTAAVFIVPASRSSRMAFSFRGVGVTESRGASVSILSSLSSSMIMSESHCKRPSSAMETSLMLQPSNGGGKQTQLGITSCRGKPFPFFFLLYPVLPGHGRGLGDVHSSLWRLSAGPQFPLVSYFMMAKGV